LFKLILLCVDLCLIINDGCFLSFLLLFNINYEFNLKLLSFDNELCFINYFVNLEDGDIYNLFFIYFDLLFLFLFTFNY
jgi:hypothetical protein